MSRASTLRRFTGGLGLLASLLVFSPQAAAQLAPACTDVFPAGTAPNASPPNVLDLPEFPTSNDGALSLANNEVRTLPGGRDYFFTSVSLGTGAALAFTGPVRVFVEGPFLVQNNARINVPGDPTNVVLLAYGFVSLGTQTEVNAILYADDPVLVLNNGQINGAITSTGPIVLGTNSQSLYDRDAIENADFGGLCFNNANPPIRLLVEYRMEAEEWTGATGEAIDTSGGGRDGTPAGGAQTSVTGPALPGNPGTCRYGEFDGIDDGIDLATAGNFLRGLPAVTIMAWVRNEAPLAGNDRGVFLAGTSPGGDRRLGLRYDAVGTDDSNVITASLNTTACPDSTNCIRVETDAGRMQVGQWQHLAITWWTTRELKIWINGVEAPLSATFGQGTGGFLDAVSALNLALGSTGQRWQGRIDEFRIFQGAMGAAEIADWKNRTFPCDALIPDHIRLLHPGSGLTCRPSDITVQACADAACSALLSEEIEVTLTSPAGNWVPNPVQFTGQTTVSLQVTAPGIVTLDAESNPAANAATRCFAGATETCRMDWFDSGFVIDAPDHVAAVPTPVSIAAVRTDDTSQRCVPAFADETRTIDFWAEFANPATGTLAVELEGQPLPATAPGTGVAIPFDAAGTGQATLVYPDAGQRLLQARYTGSGQSAGLVMTGSDAFVARPAGFQLSVPGNPAASGASGPVFTTAGAPFDVEVVAVNAAGSATPNFGRESPAESVRLEAALLAPAGGNAPPLGGAFGSFGEDCAGSAAAGTACGSHSWPEVGIIEPLPRLFDGSYLGSGDVVGPSSAPVGRFIPAAFTLDASSLRNRSELTACISGFTYFGEAIGLSWLLTARNVGGAATVNYRDAFARLGSALTGLNGDEPLSAFSSALAWNAGVGTASASVAVDRSGPREPVEDFRIGTAPVDADGVTLDAYDVDLDDDAIDDHGLLGTTAIRYGRLSLTGAIGSELGPLTLPVRAEQFLDSTWQLHTDDGCTAFLLADEVGLVSSGGDDTDGGTEVSVGGGSTSIQEPDPVDLTAGEAGFTFSAPGAPGWVDLSLLLGDRWPFLRDDLDDDGAFDDDPQARAAFGLFDGNENRILLQEIDPR